MKVYEINTAAADEKPLVTVTTLEQLANYADPEHALQAIAHWIDAFNHIQQETNNGSGTILPQSPSQLTAIVSAQKGAVVLGWDESAQQYQPAAFCALHQTPEGTPLPDGVLELGTLIRCPDTTIKGLGIMAAKAVLQLPIAQQATTVYAYANGNSFPVFTHGCAKYFGVGASVPSESELAANFPYLGAYADDTIVDLTPVKNVLEA